MYLKILKHDCGNPKACLALKWMDEHLYTCANFAETPRPPHWPIMIPQHPCMTLKCRSKPPHAQTCLQVSTSPSISSTPPSPQLSQPRNQAHKFPFLTSSPAWRMWNQPISSYSPLRLRQRIVRSPAVLILHCLLALLFPCSDLFES